MLTNRLADLSDLPTVVGFLTGLAEATRQYIPDRKTVEAGVEAILTREELKSWYWLAELHGRPVGMIRVEVLWDDLKAGEIWYLQRMYVEPGHRRTGIATALQTHARTEALRQGSVIRLMSLIQSSNAPSQILKERLGWFEKIGPTYCAELPSRCSHLVIDAPQSSSS
jgi:GNAT superfamily N-acetyltransferase